MNGRELTDAERELLLDAERFAGDCLDVGKGHGPVASRLTRAGFLAYLAPRIYRLTDAGRAAIEALEAGRTPRVLTYGVTL